MTFYFDDNIIWWLDDPFYQNSEKNFYSDSESMQPTQDRLWWRQKIFSLYSMIRPSSVVVSFGHSTFTLCESGCSGQMRNISIPVVTTWYMIDKSPYWHLQVCVSDLLLTYDHQSFYDRRQKLCSWQCNSLNTFHSEGGKPFSLHWTPFKVKAENLSHLCYNTTYSMNDPFMQCNHFSSATYCWFACPEWRETNTADSQTVYLLFNRSVAAQDFMIIMMARPRVDYCKSVQTCILHCKTVDANKSYIRLATVMQPNNLLAALATAIIDSSWDCMA